MDIIVTLTYANGEKKEFIEPIIEILSFSEIDSYLKRKYYNAIDIQWHERDTLLEDY